MAKLIIHCNGGLGNRLGGLIGGLIVADTIGSDPVVIWNPNYSCMANLSDLYDYKFSCQADGTAGKLPVLTHRRWDGYECYPHKLKSLDKLRGRDAIYANDSLPVWCRQIDAVDMLRSITIRPDIIKGVTAFCSQHQIDRDTIGLHFRRTDAPKAHYEEWCLREIDANPDRQFFLCSDEQSCEDEYARMHNIVTRPKDHYVDKRIDGPWRDDTQSPDLKYNVLRGRESVIEAFIDMLVLSRTSIMDSRASFCYWAKLYGEIEL